MGVDELFEEHYVNNGVSTHKNVSYDTDGFLKIFCVETFPGGAAAVTEKYALSFGHYVLLKQAYLKGRDARVTFEAVVKVLSRMTVEEKNRRIRLLIPNFGDEETRLLRK